MDDTETTPNVVSVGRGDTDEGETLAGPMEVVLDGNNGEDIMVEVLGSDVFVDGVRNHDSEGDSAAEVGRGGPVDEAKSVPLVQETEVSRDDPEEDLIVEDTRRLDDETQPLDETLLEEAAARNEDGEGLNSVQDCVEAAKDKSLVNGEDKLNSTGVKTHTSDIPEVSEEKLTVVENVSDEVEAKAGVPVTDVVPIKEPVSVAVESSVEITTVGDSAVPSVEATLAAVLDDAQSLAKEHNLKGECKGVPALVAGDAEMVDVEHKDSEPLEPVGGMSGDGTRMVDSDAGQEAETGQEVVSEVERVSADGDAYAVIEEPLHVETVVAESVTVVTKVVETVDKAVCEVSSDSNVNEIHPVETVSEGMQMNDMTEANEGHLDTSDVEGKGAIVDKGNVEDMEADVDTEMAEFQEADVYEFDEENMKQAGASGIGVQARYQLPPEKDHAGEYAVSDLVWGKVRSHPWWPGQIFDPSDASEKAVKYQKKDAFLVAYFGDRTFAWNETNLLKPFRSHFSAVEKQGSSEAFQNAVECALEEVSRRVEIGLACACTPKEALENIEFQNVENTGIKEESSKREGAGEYSKGNLFEPDKLMEYLKDLAKVPNGGPDRLELVVAKAQLLSFYRLKGYSLPEIIFTDGFSENAVYYREDNRIIAEIAGSMSAEEEDDSSGQEGMPQKRSTLKRKHNLRECTYPYKKGRSMTELMGSTNDEEDRRKSISVAKVTGATAPPAPKPSFKIGECIKRIASQLTGSPIVKSKESDASQSIEDSEKGAGVASEYSSMEDLLSQLQVAAQEPLQEHSFSNVIFCFFSDFRNSVVLDQNPELVKPGSGGKRKRLAHLDGSSEAFEFDDMNDSYWTDRIVENGVDEEPQSDGGGRRLEHHLVPVELKPQKTGRRPYRRRLQETNHVPQPEKPVGYIDANAPAEVVIVFPEFYLPSEANLSRMFKRFGPIRESLTEVDRETSRARVVFKKCCDAEVACSSARRFNIFGPILVTYQLNYVVSETIRSSGLALMEVPEEDGF